MDYYYLIASVLAAAHAFMFGRWLIKSGNRAGAFFVYVVVATCLALPVYRIVMAP